MQSDHIDQVDVDRDEQSNWALIPIVMYHKEPYSGRSQNLPEGTCEEAHGASNIHGIAKDIEGKPVGTRKKLSILFWHPTHPSTR